MMQWQSQRLQKATIIVGLVHRYVNSMWEIVAVLHHSHKWKSMVLVLLLLVFRCVVHSRNHILLIMMMILYRNPVRK